jgi:uncharacterized protein (TIGR03382 family)
MPRLQNGGFGLFVCLTLTAFALLAPATALAAVPSWAADSCEEVFEDSGLLSIWAAKVYEKADGSTYVLLSGRTEDGSPSPHDIYRSDRTGNTWSPPTKVDTLSTANKESGVEIVGGQAYIVSANTVLVCPWDEELGTATTTASLCPVQNGAAGAGISSDINTSGSYMYYSGGYGSGARQFDMSVDPWTTAIVSPFPFGATYGVYAGQDFGIIAVGCMDSAGAPYDCEPEVSRFQMYSYPGWAHSALSNVYSIHPYTKVASPFVAPDGSFWFVGTPNVTPEQRHLYSCAPDQNDGYCLGSADSEADCCPANPDNCEGQGCADYDCGCVPACDGRECGDDGCGGSCGACEGAEYCTAEGRCITPPSWDSDSCTEHFASSFESVWAVKVYTVNGSTYALMSGKKDGAYDIYRSDWTGMAWSPPYKVDSLSTANLDWDIEIVGNKAYIASVNDIKVCDWDEASGSANPTASLCPNQNGGSDGARSLNYRDGYMYYSGGYGSGARQFDMSVDPWTTAIVSPFPFGATYGVYAGQDFGIIAVGCMDSAGAPYDCEPEVSRFHMYTFPGWTVQSAPLSNVYDLHPDSGVGLPFVAPDGSFWFTSTNDPSHDNRHVYACQPDPADGYCAGSADSEADCCPANPDDCEGQGCADYDCGCVPSPDCSGIECGEVPDNCGGTHLCGSCDDFANSFCDAGFCDCAPDACPQAYECGPADNGCGQTLNCGGCDAPAFCNQNAHVCVCEPDCDGKDCGDDGCGASCGVCEGFDVCQQGQCVSDCATTHPYISDVSGCELEWCGSDPALDPVTIKNLSGQTCTFSMDVKQDGTPAAQVDMQGLPSCPQAMLECLKSGCALVCGAVDIDDNGQKVTAQPSGESVMTGIVGTTYAVKRYTESGIDRFEASVSAGCVWYEFYDAPRIYLAPEADCPEETTCQESVAVNLTDDEVIDPDPVDGDSDVIDGDAPDGDATDGDAPDGDATDGDAPDGDAIDGDEPDGDVIDGDAPDGDAIDGDAPDGDAIDGDAPDGDAIDGDAPDGDAIDGDAPDGDSPSSDAPPEGDPPASSDGGGCASTSGASGLLALVALGLLLLRRRKRMT